MYSDSIFSHHPYSLVRGFSVGFVSLFCPASPLSLCFILNPSNRFIEHSFFPASLRSLSISLKHVCPHLRRYALSCTNLLTFLKKHLASSLLLLSSKLCLQYFFEMPVNLYLISLYISLLPSESWEFTFLRSSMFWDVS